MTNLECLKSLSLEDFANWLDEYGQSDGELWSDWFDKTYCEKCEPVKCTVADSENVGLKPPWLSNTLECAYCELEKKCKFFENLEDVPDNKEIIKMWLMQEVRND